MRILSWNVNGIRAAEKHGFINWMENEDADIVCLQETKARPDQLSAGLKEINDKKGKPYFTYWACAKKPGYSGTAIYSRIEPLSISKFGIDEFDDEGRVLQAEFKDFTLITAYFPNSQAIDSPRVEYKLKFCAAMMKLCKKFVKEGKHFVLTGDYNIAHTEIDLARPKQNTENAGFLPEERAWMDSFIKAGFVDVFRHFHPDEKDHYTWWSYMLNARERNVGWRIDYFCVDPAFLPMVKSSIIRPEVMGSDHCPVELVLK